MTAPQQAPLHWLASTFGAFDPQKMVKFLAPTGDLPRQGRKEQVVKVWNRTYDLRDSSRKDLLYVYGTAGAGKTALLRYIAKRNRNDLMDLPRPSREWIKRVEVIAVTFNSDTPVQHFDVTDRRFFAPIVARLMFAMQNHTTSFSDFCAHLVTAYDTSSVDRLQLDSLGQLLKAIGPWSASNVAHRQFVVLLVDELAKLEQALLMRSWSKEEASTAINGIRHVLCGEMDNKPLQVIFSSLSTKPMDVEACVLTDRAIVRIDLPLLTREQSLNILFTSVRVKFQEHGSIDKDTAHVCALLEILAGGHPRTLEWIIRTLNHARIRTNVDAILRQVRSDLGTKYRRAYEAYPWTLLLLILVGEEVTLSTQVQDDPPLDIDDCVKYGYLVNPSTDSKGRLKPVLSEIQLGVLADLLSSNAQLSEEQAQVVEKLPMLLEAATRMDGRQFEMFHMYWEIVYRNALRALRNPESVRICDYYGCTATKGRLCKLRFEPGPLLNIQKFVRGPVLKHRGLNLKEFPPPRDLVVDDRAITDYVWFPNGKDFPELDFIIFVRLATGTIVPLVFQSRYSLEGSTSTLGLAAIVEVYSGARTIMKHAGWEDDEFIFVAHAFRTVADNPGQLTQIPKHVKNLMVLTKPVLLKFYGCVAPSLEFAWLRRDLQAGVQQWVEAQSQFVVHETIQHQESDSKQETKTERGGVEHEGDAEVGEGAQEDTDEEENADDIELSDR